MEVSKKKLVDLAQKLGATQILEGDQISKLQLRSVASSWSGCGCTGRIYTNPQGKFFFATTRRDVLYIARFL